MARKRLGDILLQHGWITRDDLTRARRVQQIVGGRLGTALLENESLSEELLLAALAEQHGVDAASIDDLRSLDPEVLELIPRKLAVRCRTLPFKAAGGRLDVVTDEPSNLPCQDEIAFVTSRRVRILVSSEVRILEALSLHYDEPPPGRFVGLIDRLNRQRTLRRDADSHDVAVDELFRDLRAPLPPPAPVPPPDAPAPTAAPPPRRAVRPRPTAVALSEAERAEIYGGPSRPPEPAAPPSASPPPAAVAPARGPLTYADAEERLATTKDRDEVGQILLHVLRQIFDRVMILRVGRDAVHGWLGGGDGLDNARVAHLAVPFDRPSIFLNLRHGSGFHLGPLPAMPSHRPLVALLGGEAPRECLLLPVRLGERMVVVVYCDRGGDRLAGLDLEALRHLGERSAAAFERCISLKRQAHSGPPAG